MGEHPAVPFSPPLIPPDSRRKAGPAWPPLAPVDHLPSKCRLLATPRVTGLMGSESGLAAPNPSLPAKPTKPRPPWPWGTCLRQQLSSRAGRPGQAGVSESALGGVSCAGTGWELDQGVLRGPLRSTGSQTSLVSLPLPQPTEGKGYVDLGGPGFKPQLLPAVCAFELVSSYLSASVASSIKWV